MQALKDDLRGAALTAYSGAPGAPRAAACSPPWHLGSSSGACPASVCVQSPIPMLGLVGSRDRNLYVSREGDSGCSGHGWVPPPAKKAPCAHPSCEQLVHLLGTCPAALAPTLFGVAKSGSSTLQGGAHICGQMVLRTPELGLEVGNSFLPAPQPSSAGLPGHVIGSLYLLILAIKQSSSVRNPVRAFDSCSCDSQQL